ncbi:MAG: acetyl-CoA carboxylase biotin carboxylase subunit family protein [Actinomycetales bacterium]
MSLLILHRNPFEPFDYRRWLADVREPVFILAAADKLRAFGESAPDLPFARIEVFDDFDSPAVDQRARTIVQEQGVTRLIAEHEADLQRAAELRAELGLPGASPRAVLPFRDKLVMKRTLAEAGLEVAEHALAADATTVRDFARDHGLPVVLKDRAGFNSIGLRILVDSDGLESALAEAFGERSQRDDLIVEGFVGGRMCHVDGLVVGDAVELVWPSQYQYDLASFGADPGARVDLTLDPGDPLTPRLRTLTQQAVTALRQAGGPASGLRNHAFHAEIFHTEDDRLVICEVACRSGGAKTREVFHAMFGVNLAHCALRLQAGLEAPAELTRLLAHERREPRRMAGQVSMMKRPGRVYALPEAPGEPWVERYWCFAQPDQVIPMASGSADFLAVAVACAPSRAECESRLRNLGRRFERETLIQG